MSILVHTIEPKARHLQCMGFNNESYVSSMQGCDVLNLINHIS